MANTRYLKLSEKLSAIDWLLKQGRDDHSLSCNHSDPDSYGPCTCGYLEDKKNREILLNYLVT